MKVTLVLTALFSSTLAFAGNTEAQPEASKVVTSIVLDMDKDSAADTAYLARSNDPSESDLDLWVKLSSSAKYYKVTGIAQDMNGGMAGQGTALVATPAGSLQVMSYNESVGRTRWEERVTLAYRRNTLTLAGYTYTQRDTLDLTYDVCDVNLLSLKGEYKSNFGDVSFDVQSKDRLNLNNASATNLQDKYLNNYCYTFDLGEDGDF